MTGKPLTFKDLWQEGINLIEHHSSHIWTDYNTHDPGVTQLDHLCYALADLGYRVDQPIADLLANPKLAGLAGTAFPAETILTCRPVNNLDFRMILIDLDHVRNAWLEPMALTDPTIYVDCRKELLRLTPPPNHKERTIAPKGGYRVLLEPEDTLPQGVTAADVIDQARIRLHAHRNLCEDFLEIKVVETQYVGLCAELETKPDADLARVHALFLYAVENFIAPRPQFFSLREMQQRGFATEEIFHGPLLQHGFMDPQQLATTERPSELHLSDLIQVIMDLEGITAVRSLTATSYKDGQPVVSGAPWILKLDPAHATRFAETIGQEPDTKRITRVLYYKNGVPFVPDAAEVAEHLLALRAGERLNKLPDTNNTFPEIAGNWPEPDQYFAIQNEFPLAYGIGKHGLPPSSSDQRKARAHQLKAWLLLFEQFMANYLAQLAHVPMLFSTEEIDRTLFSQIPEDIAELDSLLRQSRPDYQKQLNAIAETPSDFRRRRNRFLDHLLARFGERFTEYVVIATRVYGMRADRQIIRDKLRYLRNYPQLSAHRFAGFNILNPVGEEARSGLERKLNILLGEIDDHFEIFQMPGGTFKLRMWSDDGRQLLTSFKGRPDQQTAQGDIMPLLQVMSLDAAYVRGQTASKWNFYIEDNDATQLTLKQSFNTEEERDDAIEELKKFQEDYPAGSNVLLFEHFLLRPRGPGYLLLPACIRPGDGPCYCDDPYSFRVHVVLPYWLPRFLDMNFRRFMEQTIRELLPAHVLPSICWIGRKDLEELSECNRLWRNALKNNAPDLETHQNNLVTKLASLRSVFPEAELHDCIDGGDENPIVLDNTILGTFDPDDPDEP